MKVCHLTTVHKPFDVRIFQKECRALVEAGHDVSLVARHERDETVKGVRILALPEPKGRLDRWLRLSNRCYQRALESGADLFHFHDPELIGVGLKLKRRGKLVIYDVHESHAESLLDRAYLAPPLRTFFSRLVARNERRADRELDGIVAATPKIRDTFVNSRTVLVQNFPVLGELAKSEGLPLADREPAFAYLGGLSAIRGAREMVAALAQVPHARLKVIGEVTPAALQAELTGLPGGDRIDFLGFCDRQQVAHELGRCVAGLVLFHPLRNHIESQPNKLFEYMSAGLPVVASDFDHWRKIVDSERCGHLVDPLDTAAIARSMRAVLDDLPAAEAMGERGKSAVLQRYNWNAEKAKLLRLYEDLA